MPTKIYSIQNLDCANCAAKAEEKIRKVPGVEQASITFATMQLRLTAEDPDALLPQVLAAARTVEGEIQFLSREDAAALLADYTSQYPRKNLLTPRQKELLKALQQRT